MGCPYSREHKATQLLTQIGIEYFLPIVSDGTLKVTPHGVEQGHRLLVRNLIFVHSDLTTLISLKKGNNTLLQFIVDRNAHKISVPDSQMEAFMRVCEYSPEKTVLLTESDLSQLRENARVRIIDGWLKGVEGYYQQVRGHGKKKIFVVKLDLICGCATTLSECTAIQFI